MDERQLTPQEQELLAYHRHNLLTNALANPDGSLTTIYLMGIGGPDGREYLVPGYFDGKKQGVDAAAQRAEQMGWEHFPSYGSPQEGEAAAKRLHKIIDRDDRTALLERLVDE